MPRSLHIGYLSGSPRISTRPDADNVGPRAHILGFVAGLRADGHDVREFIVGDRIGSTVNGQGSARLTGGGRAKQLAVDVARLGLRPVVARRARRALPGHLDVVYERHALFQELGASWKRRGVPWVVESNAFLAEEARHERGSLALQRTAAQLERRTYARADLVVAISERLRVVLREQAGVPDGKLLVVPNGVDTARFSGAPVPAGAADDALVVGFVGFVIARQGLDELVQAVAALRRRGTRIRAVVVGDGPDLARLQALAAAEGVADAVSFPGQVPWEQMPETIAGFTVGYSGQRGVGGMTMYHSPLKIYEYLASARPVIASAHPDAERVVAASQAGWVFPAGDAAGLTELLGRVAETTRDELAAAGRRGREHVEAHHTWQQRSRLVVDALHDRGLLR